VSQQVRERAPTAADARGNETILLVEDEKAILRMTTMVLQRLGYTVLEANTPGRRQNKRVFPPGMEENTLEFVLKQRALSGS
jgi:CheY-like chemotaxis protein